MKEQGGVHGHKGAEAAITALKMISISEQTKQVKRMRVEIFVPCFIDQLYPQTAFNMVKVLSLLRSSL